MTEREHRVLVWLLLLAASAVVLPSLPAFAAPSATLGSVSTDFTPSSMYVVGDIMLGRGVERKMDAKGAPYPTSGTKALISKADISLANFEAAIPKDHVPTQDMHMQLSVKASYMRSLADAGFDVLSLANNHSHDFGQSGFLNTRSVCTDAGMTCIGDQTERGAPLVYIKTIGSTRVGVIALYAVNRTPDLKALTPILKQLFENSDYQVAFIHWGVEYKDTHNAAQEKLAHALVDLGIDAVIGAHPHVVEDIEVYKGKPIFYSLGNFIFDQYFSNDVEQGLTLAIQFEKPGVVYTLIPVTSSTTPSQPHPMPVDARNTFVSKLFARSAVPADLRNGASLHIPW